MRPAGRGRDLNLAMTNAFVVVLNFVHTNVRMSVRVRECGQGMTGIAGMPCVLCCRAALWWGVIKYPDRDWFCRGRASDISDVRLEAQMMLR